ncbi:MAG: hypothetical protein GY757_01880 [bacterium]|nr:hypothetical protein [bacterium]
MKFTCMLVSVLIFISLPVCADVFVKGVLHIDGGYRYGRTVQEVNADNLWWFAKNKVTYISKGLTLKVMDTDLRVTLDKEKNHVIVSNLKEKSYVIVPLDKEPMSIADPAYPKRIEKLQHNGTVKKEAGKKFFLGKSCDSYDLYLWLMEVDLKVREKKRTVLATTDVPFDYLLNDKLTLWIHSLLNIHPDYTAQLKKIKGFVLKTEEMIVARGSKEKWDFKVLDISEKKAPANIYGIPANFKRKDKLAVYELDALKNLLYPYPIF